MSDDGCEECDGFYAERADIERVIERWRESRRVCIRNGNNHDALLWEVCINDIRRIWGQNPISGADKL
jgi:hypothetical protein